MPWTFAHPAAVLPLRRRFDMPALVIGSLMPDAAYYVHAFAVSTYAHTFAGSIAVCVPLGFALLCVWHLLRVPLIALLPQPHRAFWMRMPSMPPWRSPRNAAIACVSLLLGAWTHCAWDGFTHRSGWAVALWPAMRERPWDAIDLPLYGALQHASTLIGVAALAFAYRRARHSGRPLPARSRGDPMRCAVLLVAAIVATGMAGYVQLSAGLQRATMFRFVVDATAWFAVLLLACALVRRTLRPA